MNMKDMIQRLTDLENEKTTLNESAVAECGGPAMPPAPVGNPVTMSVTLNASGKDHVSDLINMMKNAGLNAAQPVAPEMMPMRMDMEKFRGIVDSDEMPREEASMDDEVEEWANTPEGSDGEEKYFDPDVMTKDLAGGINREKKMFKKAQDGDNAMAVETIKQRLIKSLEEKKAKPDFLDADGDGDKEEPMKKAFADKKNKKSVEEGKWDYPDHMKKTVTTSDMGTTNAQRNREDRKAFRKKEKAKAHAALMKGKK